MIFRQIIFGLLMTLLVIAGNRIYFKADMFLEKYFKQPKQLAKQGQEELEALFFKRLLEALSSQGFLEARVAQYFLE